MSVAPPKEMLPKRADDLPQITADQEGLLKADPERSAFQPSVPPARPHYLLILIF